jgi:purine-binding chemotaxis protein CheW
MSTVSVEAPTAAVFAAAQAADSAQAVPLQYLRLAAGQENHAVRVDAVREILEVSRMTPLPLMPSFVRGVMNLRGAVVPVIDLGARLGLSPTVLGRRSCVVIVDSADENGETTQRLGLLVEAVYEVFDVPADQLEPVPRLGTRVDPAFICNVVRVRGQATPELNVATVLDQAVLAELITAHAGDAVNLAPAHSTH